MDISSLLLWHKFNCYRFEESSHSYFYNDKRVNCSVTQFTHRFFQEFESDTIATKYAKKHNLVKDEVLKKWEKEGNISSVTGTIIHSYLENAKRGKVFDVDFSQAEKYGIVSEVKEKLNVLLPQAEAFHKDTLNKLFPIQLEYTVGIEDVIAGNIDMLCWNEKAQEFQIWDYKNLKTMTTANNYGHTGMGSFRHLPDCHLVKYSIQQNLYKAMLQRELGIEIGKCYLVHFNSLSPSNTFDIYKCYDLQNECNVELNNLISEVRNGG